MSRRDLLEFTDRGIFCPEGDFHIDPWKPVERAVVTHAHSDHARPGHRRYLAHPLTVAVLRLRLGQAIDATGLDYGSPIRLKGVTVSLHPAGHVPGSAQVRVERDGEIWVAAGDYKTRADGLSTAWEPIRCHAFITESTFALPIYRWPDPAEVRREMLAWIDSNRAAGKASLISAYPLGKAQRLQHMLGAAAGDLFVHPSVCQVNQAFRAAGLNLPDYPS
jgi:putative mRNA 3-end processing factor